MATPDEQAAAYWGPRRAEAVQRRFETAAAAGVSEFLTVPEPQE